MYNTILVAMALDHDVSQKTLGLAQTLCAEGGTIYALHVLEEPPGAANPRLREDLLSEGTKRATMIFEQKLAAFPGVEPVLAHGHASRTIIEMAQEKSADCIVMGSHKPGLADYFIGSTASRVVRHADCSVHVYRGEAK